MLILFMEHRDGSDSAQKLDFLHFQRQNHFLFQDFRDGFFLDSPVSCRLTRVSHVQGLRASVQSRCVVVPQNTSGLFFPDDHDHGQMRTDPRQVGRTPERSTVGRRLAHTAHGSVSRLDKRQKKTKEGDSVPQPYFSHFCLPLHSPPLQKVPKLCRRP